MGKVLDIQELKSIRNNHRQVGKKVVFTNGVFDIIHRGHIEYLTKAKSLGDVLIVGINSDSSVHRIKGDKRPIVNQEDRAFVVSNLTPVDYVCLFDADTPYNIISNLVPDILVKGADWDINEIVGKDIVEKSGGKVIAVDFIPERSTTSIINRIIERFSSE